jgi:hypothetical protein
MVDNLSDWADKGYIMKDGQLVKANSQKKKGSKYRNTKVIIDDITFHSTKEGMYYTRLKLLKKSGEVKDFKMQVKYPVEINGVHITNYLLDFEVEYPDGRIEYIDVKGYDKKTEKFITTDVFKLKKKMVEAIYNIEIKLTRV